MDCNLSARVRLHFGVDREHNGLTMAEQWPNNGGQRSPGWSRVMASRGQTLGKLKGPTGDYVDMVRTCPHR